MDISTFVYLVSLLFLVFFSVARSKTVNLTCDAYFGEVGQTKILNCSGATLGLYSLTWYKKTSPVTKETIYARNFAGIGIGYGNYSSRFDILPGDDCSLRINDTVENDYGFVYQVESGASIQDVDETQLLLRKQDVPAYKFDAQDVTNAQQWDKNVVNGGTIAITGKTFDTPASEILWFCRNNNLELNNNTNKGSLGLSALSMTTNYIDNNGCQMAGNTTSTLKFTINDGQTFKDGCVTIYGAVQQGGELIEVSSAEWTILYDTATSSPPPVVFPWWGIVLIVVGGILCGTCFAAVIAEIIHRIVTSRWFILRRCCENTDAESGANSQGQPGGQP